MSIPGQVTASLRKTISPNPTKSLPVRVILQEIEVQVREDERIEERAEAQLEYDLLLEFGTQYHPL